MISVNKALQYMQARGYGPEVQLEGPDASNFELSSIPVPSGITVLVRAL